MSALSYRKRKISNFPNCICSAHKNCKKLGKYLDNFYAIVIPKSSFGAYKYKINIEMFNQNELEYGLCTKAGDKKI
jgi:hypothetical protein